MKKIKCLKYLLFFFALFIISSEVKAVCDLTSGECTSMDFKVNPGAQTVILSSNVNVFDYCTSDNGYYNIYQSGAGDVRAEYNNSKGLPKSAGSDTYTCAGVSTSGNGFIISGTLSYDKDESVVLLQKTFSSSYENYNIRQALGNPIIKSLNVTSGQDIWNNYFYSYCYYGSYCYAYIYNYRNVVGTVEGTIEYYHPAISDYVVTAKFIFNLQPDVVMVSVPSYCTVSSGWTNLSGSIYYIPKNNFTSYPSCPSKPTGEPYKTFAGYIQSDTAMPNLNEYPTCSGATTSASRYNVKTYNAACYKTSQYFEFDAGSGSLSGSQFTKSGSYYIYNGSSITLPTPTAPSGYEFKKWSSNKGEATAGTTVTLDATETKRGYQAIYAKKATAESITKNLVLNLNETKELNSYFSFHVDSSKNVNISSSEPDKVAVSKGSSSYYVNGKAKTSNPVTVSMEFYDNTGDWISAIINVTVIEDSDDAYVPPTETLPENPAEHYIDDGSEQSTNPEIGGLTTTSMSACEKGYTVYYPTSSTKLFDYSGQKNNMNKYEALNKCDNKKYDAICLDPAKKNPPKGGKSYKPAEKLGYTQLDPSKGGFDAAMYYFAKALNDGADYGAIFFAARVAVFYYGEGSTSGAYSYHAKAYEAFANALGSDGSFPSSVSGMKFTSYGEGVKNAAETYFKEAINAGASEGTSEDADLTVEETSHRSYWDESDRFVYEQKGTIISNGGIAVLGLEQDCDGTYYTCESTSTRSGNNLNYTIKIRVKITSSTPAPNEDLSLTKFKIKLSGSAGTSGAAFIIYPETDASSYQRFVVFHPASSDAYLYVRIGDGECKFIKPALNGNCSNDAECGQVNQDWWEFLHCCDLITDTSSFAYEYLCAGEDCYSENFLNECEYPGDNAPIDIDVYSVREAENKAGTKQYKCIVAISKKCTKTNSNCSEAQKRTATDAKKDKSNNKYSIKDYMDESNPYCRVSCKEDWNIGSSAFGNYTGVRAVEAGSYFMINKDLFVGTTRTCVTTKIDIKAYAQKVEEYANKLLNAWNKYNYYQAKWQRINDRQYKVDKWNDTYHVFSANHKHDCGCDEWNYDKDGNATSCKKKCYYDCAAHDNYKNCKEYKITLNSPFDYVNYKDDGSVHDGQKSASPGAINGGTYDGKYSWQTTNTTSGDHWTQGSCDTRTDEDLRSDALRETEGFISSYRSLAQTYRDKIDTESLYFSRCQNFVLNVSEGDFKASTNNVKSIFGTGNSYTTVGSIYSKSAQTREIKSLFAPFIQYFYEETEFMEVLLNEKKNYMVAYEEENTELLGTDYMSANNVRAAIPGAEDDIGRQMYLARNYYTTDSYKASDDGNDDESLYNPEPTGEGYILLSDKGSAQTFGQSDDSDLGIKAFSICIWSGGYGKDESANKCASAMMYYYKDANFIKHTLSNSSYFKNWGDWFLNNVTDEKVHAENLQDTSKITNPDDWTLYGGHNVFPVSMDTKANLYRYQYKFYNIGMYNDGALGRIMGGQVEVPSGNKKNNGHSDETILIQENYHNCLYEVYESICRCCGEEIVTYAYFIEGQTPPEYVDETGAIPGTSSNTVINEAQIGAFTNTISLANFSSATQRVLGANWKAQTPFFLEGEIHDGANGTDQGAFLIKGIQEKGDEIYNETPEYSYVLNPSAITSIRSYNSGKSYIPDVSGASYVAAEGEHKGTGYKNVGGGETGWLVSNEDANDRLRFFHYTSKYLKDTLSAYETPKYKSSLFTNKTKICYISANNDTELEAKVKDLVKNGPSAGCKWVDYVTPEENIRLAFK